MEETNPSNKCLYIYIFMSTCCREGLSRMAVVIKMSGAGFQSDRRREGSVSTARRLAHLSQTARLGYGFRTVDTWNMTVARFRDFLPGRCRCHFHQVSFIACAPWFWFIHFNFEAHVKSFLSLLDFSLAFSTFPLFPTKWRNVYSIRNAGLEFFQSL